MNMASYASNSASVVLAMCRTALLLVAAIVALGGASNAENGLKVDKLYMPEVCDVRSKKGDQLTMHYTGTLQDGSKFDSRIYKHYHQWYKSTYEWKLIRPSTVKNIEKI